VHLALGRPPRPVAAAAEPGGAIALRAVEAVGEPVRPRLERYGFYDRRRLGFGKHLTHEEFARLPGARLLDRIMAMGGIYVEPHTSEAFSLYRPYRGTRCYYALFVDGRQESNQILNRLTVDEVEAVELYRGYEIPGRFNPYYSDDWNCGALVIWTKPSNQP
jgi:ribosomal protein S18 acetylase RimI-like enzyme